MKPTEPPATTDTAAAQPPSRSAARNGKIARLPAALRDQLGHRLDDGQPANVILGWLNAEPAVVAILRDQFGGVPVSPQNLSEWRAGGYLDWQRAQERLAFARQITEESGLSGPADHATLADNVSARLVLALASLVPDEITPPDLPRVVSLSKELDRHRRADRQQSLDELRRAEWNAGAAERAQLAEARARKARRDAILAPVFALRANNSLRSQYGRYDMDEEDGRIFAEAAEAEHGCPGALIAPAEPPPVAPAKSPSRAAAKPSAGPPHAPRASALPVPPRPAPGQLPPAGIGPFVEIRSAAASLSPDSARIKTDQT